MIPSPLGVATLKSVNDQKVEKEQGEGGGTQGRKEQGRWGREVKETREGDPFFNIPCSPKLSLPPAYLTRAKLILTN